jgi:hypothetical protein|tara:strand:+ start:155 stop:388 length:234 start_codon:yes stop_codon:yes gene_type:complete
MLPRAHEKHENGTEKDGAENKLYCKMCYAEGTFNNPEIKTAKDMQDFIKDILKKQGVGKVKRWFYTIGIPKLERWNN